MNQMVAVPGIADEVFFLSEIIGSRAMCNGRKLGKLVDVIAVDQGKLAEITQLQIRPPFGDPAMLVPYSAVRSLSHREVVIELTDPKSYVREPTADEVLVRDYLFDKKVLDIEDREVEVVYDIRLLKRNGKLFVTDVDISRYGLFRRLGLASLAKIFYERSGEEKKRLIAWSYVQALGPNLSSLQGELKLNILKEALSETHPADLADIVEELDSGQRVTLFEELEPSLASDTLEEIDPAVQRDVVFALKKDRVARLIGEMTPGQAADIVSVLPADERRIIAKLLDIKLVDKIREIIEKQETNILNFTTSKFLKCRGEMAADETLRHFRRNARGMDVVMYFYIVDEKDRLLGVLDIKELLMADLTSKLSELMVENVISLKSDSTMKEAAAAFLRYGFRALPVVDDGDVLQGVVPYRDVMNLKHRMLD
ncbi:CBS domain containing protein [Candidatus Sulfotelmatomonas gaucii]|uniref:CBS domain containing protein n=1 Tax=Candidatus Sulfuritelmatomonas gaucii TaxID=2043161 RepID=A0A2N9LYV3_9BACT|nr:CBS domain containing protein [Candidatus Sulfotelmatomonas gaucii]